MRVLIQRVKQASVAVGGEAVGRIGSGLLVFVGIGVEDGESVLDPMAQKILNLRIFGDAEGKMNRSLIDAGGEILAVSQFTLHADCGKGRRPNFMRSAPPEIGSRLFDLFVQTLRSANVKVETGRFGAMMEVCLINDGPVTIWLDSEELGIR
ncbi:D-tyrosyl-tRNA(Tyr) deacylase [Candidatus Sumerlaeota bacterium]|nr:D-tyrosyl-tRNA(Tyr) deacylase [Candidatus Sumerlaeota bacterium]